MHYFLGIDLQEDVVKELVRIQLLIKTSRTCVGSWVHQDKFHITLIFLGKLTDKELSSVCHHLTALSTHSFSVALQKLEVPTWSSPRLIWVRAGSNGLIALHNSLVTACSSSKEHHTFTGHCTLARLQKVSDTHALQKLIESISLAPLTWHVTRFKLYSSHTHLAGTKYTVVSSFELLQG